ncbi:MAG: Crp/Fnr family transcriptional regulator [Ichthyobacteriaceae bacterium]|nr:Crp/Fnr family transcriptional regulator [Ichthyobacteriaceae bacterium]
MECNDSNLSCLNCKEREGTVLDVLTDKQLQLITDNKTCVVFKKGQIIMHEGNNPNGVYCLKHGKCKTHKLGIEGKEQIIRFAKSGDLLGYRAILSDEPLSASITALEETRACFIPRQELFELIEQSPSFSMQLMKVACHDLGEAGRIITNLAQKTVRERLAEMLLLLESTFGVTSDGNLDVSLTREEIANLVGTATESTIRLLSEFKEDKLIVLKGRKIKLVERGKLAKLGNVFD